MGTRQLSVLLESSVAAGHELKSLCVGNLSWDFFNALPNRNKWIYRVRGYVNPEVWECFKSYFNGDLRMKRYHKGLEAAFHHFNHLDFRFESNSSENKVVETHRLGHAIRSAKELRCLVLDFGTIDDAPQVLNWDTISLEKLMGKPPLTEVIWPHLTFLELHNVKASPVAWMAFMKARSFTL